VVILIPTVAGCGGATLETRGEKPQTIPSAAEQRRHYFIIMGALVIVTFLVVSTVIVLTWPLYPPYPDESTPLELQTWGVTWTRNFIQKIDGKDGIDYTSMYVRFGVTHEHGYEILGFPAWHALNMDFAEFSAPANPMMLADMERISNGNLSELDHLLWVVGIFITDDEDDGRFGYEDSICLFRMVYENGELVQQGFDEDVMYLIGLEYGESHGVAFEFAVHRGNLYSWAYYDDDDIEPSFPFP